MDTLWAPNSSATDLPLTGAKWKQSPDKSLCCKINRKRYHFITYGYICLFDWSYYSAVFVSITIFTFFLAEKRLKNKIRREIPPAAIVLTKVKHASKRVGLWNIYALFSSGFDWFYRTCETAWVLMKAKSKYHDESGWLKVLQIQPVCHQWFAPASPATATACWCIVWWFNIDFWKEHDAALGGYWDLNFAACNFCDPLSMYQLELFPISATDHTVREMYEGKLTKAYCGQAWRSTE